MKHCTRTSPRTLAPTCANEEERVCTKHECTHQRAPAEKTRAMCGCCSACTRRHTRARVFETAPCRSAHYSGGATEQRARPCSRRVCVLSEHALEPLEVEREHVRQPLDAHALLGFLQRAARVAEELVLAAQRLRRREVAHARRNGRVLRGGSPVGGSEESARRERGSRRVQAALKVEPMLSVERQDERMECRLAENISF
eukprot:6193298-Pleurochrysis_carterae.AAC.1